MKHFTVYLLVLVLIVRFQPSACKRFTRCGLTEELLRQGFPRTFVGNWVCLIESESAKDTSKVINKANGSKGLGLFQINSKDWCTFKKRGGLCNIKCEDLINDNITDDSACAKKIQGQAGFRGWDGWVRNCYGLDNPIPNC